MREKPTMIVPQPLIVGLFLTPCLATLLQLIGVCSQSWAVWTDHILKQDVYIGVWYSEVCYIETGECKRMSHHQEHLDNIANGDYHKEVQYTLRVVTEVKTTVALIFSVASCVLSILALCNTKHVLRFSLGAVVSIFISGCFMILPVISLASELMAQSKIVQYTVYKRTYHFPWALCVSGLGGLVAVITGTFMCILLTVKLKVPATLGESSTNNSYIDVRPNNQIPRNSEETKIPLNDFSSDDSSS